MNSFREGSAVQRTESALSTDYRHVQTFAEAQGTHRSCSGADKERVKVAIIEDSDKTRFLLQEILEQSGEYECVGSYPSGERALYDAPCTRPALVLMDIRLPGISGIECTRLLKAILPGLRVILVSVLADRDTISAARKAGGDYYLKKPFSIDQCLIALRFTLDWSCNCTGSRSAGELLFASGDGKDTRLTSREDEVMSYLSEGLLYKEIAERLHISYSAVNQHLHNVFMKMHVNNGREAMRKWLAARPNEFF